MTAIRVQTTLYNRQFKLLDPPGAHLQDGQTYLIMAEQPVLADRGVRMSNPMTGVL